MKLARLMRNISHLLFLFSLFLTWGTLSGCSEGGLSPLDGVEAVGVETLSEGAFLEPGQEIPLTLYRRDALAEPDVLEILLEDGEGLEIVSRREEQYFSDGEVFRQFHFPDGQPDGLYLLTLRVYGSGRLLHESRRRFYQVSDDLRIRNLFTYPAELRPEATVILDPDVLWTGAEPLRYQWSVNGQVIDGGTGQSFIRWQVPPEEGIYSLRLDLFPGDSYQEALATGQTLPLSAVHEEADVYVSRRISPASHELNPLESFQEISHFKGDLRREIRGDSWTAQGTPLPVLGNHLYGYRLGPGDSLVTDSFALPLDEGRLQPFTLFLRTEELEEEPAGILFETRDSSGFGLFVSRRGPDTWLLTVELPGGRRGTATVVGPGPVTAFSCFPQEAGLQVRGYRGGAVGETVEVPYGSWAGGDLRGEGKTLLGGQGRSPFIIDEYGIYSQDARGRPNTYPHFFKESQETLYPGRLLFAEGFDGLYWPEKWSSSGGVGRVPLSGAQRESLELPEGAFRLQFHFDRLSGLTPPPRGEIALLWDSSSSGSEPEPFFTVELNQLGADGVLSLPFLRKGNQLRLDVGGERWIEVPSEGALSTLLLTPDKNPWVLEGFSVIEIPGPKEQKQGKEKESWAL